jgi:FkbM family methyltransferase
MRQTIAINRAIQSALIQAHAWCDGQGVTRTRTGRWLRDQAYGLYKGHLESAPVDALRPFAPRDSTIIDVGANIGFFTQRFARWVGALGRVLAIEPEPRNLERLAERLAASGLGARVEVVSGAAVERRGTFALAVNPLHPGDHRLAPDGLAIEGFCIDGLLAERGLRAPSLIKIDVQGAEMRVLAGAAATLAAARPALFIEIDDGALAAQGASAGAVETMLADLGYRQFAWRGHGWHVVATRAEAAERRAGLGYADYLFLAHEDARRAVLPFAPRAHPTAAPR